MAGEDDSLKYDPDGTGNPLPSYCTGVDFGPVPISADEERCFTRLNGELSALCMSLPEPTQTDAFLFLMQYYGIRIGDQLDFFKDYYAPAWSIIYWLEKRLAGEGGIEDEVLKMVFSAQAMALFLHSLDNHLSEGDVAASHLALLLRSQAWLILTHAVTGLSSEINQGEQTVRNFLNTYYAALSHSENQVSLDSYCRLFRSQMATGFIAPVLLTQKLLADESFTRAIEAVYGSFGIAWRLLDDVRDMEADMMKGQHTAVHACLPEGMRRYWDGCAGNAQENDQETKAFVLNSLWKERIIDTILARICRELMVAASLAEECGMFGLANEFRCLNVPFRAFEDIP